MLIMDECTSHLTSSVNKELNDVGTQVEIIPGGYTSKLQVMDVGINRPFKHHIRNQHDNFLISGQQKPTRVDVSNWIDNAWKNIKDISILNTWRHIGYLKKSEMNPLSFQEIEMDYEKEIQEELEEHEYELEEDYEDDLSEDGSSVLEYSTGLI